MVTSMLFPPAFVNSPIAQVNRPKILERMVSGSSLLCSEVFVTVKLGLHVHGFKLVRTLGYNLLSVDHGHRQWGKHVHFFE